MKTKLVPLTGDIHESLYQLGLAEKESFLKLERKVLNLLSTSTLLRQGQDLVTRTRTLLKKKNEKKESFYDSCLKSYAEGLGRDLVAYQTFLSLFEIAAHYGGVYPELRSIIPGCASVYTKKDGELTHSRLVDFPLVGHLDETPRLYLWQLEGHPTVLSYGCEGLAPAFFQVLHESGSTLALHYKPGKKIFSEGQSIFQIIFELLFDCKTPQEMKRDLKKKVSVTKWGLLLLEKKGKLEHFDIEGPTLAQESFEVTESGPLIFTNIPLKHDKGEFESHLNLCSQRQAWIKTKLGKSSRSHVLDLLTDISDQKENKWIHPGSSLSTTGAISLNLTKGHLDVKEGSSALVASDALVRFSLSDQREVTLLKPAKELNDFEKAWKGIALAQACFDAGEMDFAYHHLQMARALIPHKVWKQILGFYLCVWDFKFIQNTKELSHVYKGLRKLDLPDVLKHQGRLLNMRLERKLGLVVTVKEDEFEGDQKELFLQEMQAGKALFSTWMHLLYPRMEILDVFSPHLK